MTKAETGATAKRGRCTLAARTKGLVDVGGPAASREQGADDLGVAALGGAHQGAPVAAVGVPGVDAVNGQQGADDLDVAVCGRHAEGGGPVLGGGVVDVDPVRGQEDVHAPHVPVLARPNEGGLARLRIGVVDVGAVRAAEQGKDDFGVPALARPGEGRRTPRVGCAVGVDPVHGCVCTYC